MPVRMGSALGASRRKFLSRVGLGSQTGLMAFLAGRLSSATARPARGEQDGPIRIDELTREQMQAHVGTPFRLIVNTRESIHMRLVEVTAQCDARDERAPTARRAPFSIVFQAPPEPVLAQRMYELQHETLGTLNLFLVPIGPDNGGMGYEAVLN